MRYVCIMYVSLCMCICYVCTYVHTLYLNTNSVNVCIHTYMYAYYDNTTICVSRLVRYTDCSIFLLLSFTCVREFPDRCPLAW